MSPSTLLSEIAEQPARLTALLTDGAADVATLATALRSRDLQHVVIAARGSSDNAARYAQYVFGAFNHLTVTLAAPSLFTRYHAPPRMAGSLVIGISQSGESPDLVAVVAEGRRQGCVTLALTNTPGSALTQVAEYTLLMRAGFESSVAATKTYTAELFALAMLSAALAGDQERRAQLARVPAQVNAALQMDEDALGAAVAVLHHAARAVVIGRGFNYATVFEIALKIKELARVAAEPYSVADFQHGPITLLDASCAAVVVNVLGAVSQEVEGLLCRARSLGVKAVVLSNLDSSRDLASVPLMLPVDVPEWLSPIVAIVPGQVLAHHLGIARGLDTDHPRGISKITRTT